MILAWSDLESGLTSNTSCSLFDCSDCFTEKFWKIDEQLLSGELSEHQKFLKIPNRANSSNTCLSDFFDPVLSYVAADPEQP